MQQFFSFLFFFFNIWLGEHIRVASKEEEKAKGDNLVSAVAALKIYINELDPVTNEVLKRYDFMIDHFFTQSTAIYVGRVSPGWFQWLAETVGCPGPISNIKLLHWMQTTATLIVHFQYNVFYRMLISISWSGGCPMPFLLLHPPTLKSPPSLHCTAWEHHLFTMQCHFVTFQNIISSQCSDTRLHLRT